jgi:hypothetical protein
MKVLSNISQIFNPYHNTSDYSVNITNGYQKPNRYVEMKHGQQYGVTMRNNTSTSCQATLTIDGEHMGDFLIKGYSSITIDRPTHSHKKFTFYRTDSSSSFHTGIIPGRSYNGVVEVTFIPERNYQHQKHHIYKNTYDSNNSNREAMYCNASLDSLSYSPIVNEYAEGGTALSGHSSQSFKYVRPLDLDYSRQVTLSLRLVAVKYDHYGSGDIYVEPMPFRQRPPPPVSKPFPDVFPDPYFGVQPLGRNVVREW